MGKKQKRDGASATVVAEAGVEASAKVIAKKGAKADDDEAVTVVKNKVLVLSTRGVTARYRHLMDDLRNLLPHGKKEPKMDTKEKLSVANEICELRGCNWCVLFECRKKQDLYLWMAASPNGPSVKFHVSNVHTMAELKFTGNNLLFSRPILSFDKKFSSSPHLKMLKEILSNVFAAPKGHKKTKPSIDHVISFHILDERIWVRHYQIVEATAGMKPSQAEKSSTSDLVEIGPRFVLSPVRIFSGSFFGSTVYENPAFVHPNVVRRMIRKRSSQGYEHRIATREKKKKRTNAQQLEKNPVNEIFRQEPEDVVVEEE